MVLRIMSQMAAAAPRKEDTLAKLVGELGMWQLVVVAPLALVKVSSGWVQLAILFLTPSYTFRCTQREDPTATMANGTCYDDCRSYEVDTSPFDNTIVSEWGLVCDRAWLASFTQMALQLGILIGSILFGFLSDRFGRRSTFLATVVLMVGLGLGVPFSPSYTVFTVLRFGLGLATAGTMVVSFVIIMESIGPQYRELFGCFYQIPFVMGHMTLAIFGYYFRSWNTYSLALAALPVLYLGYVFLVSESPRWLLSVGRVEEATKIIKRAAEMNKLPTANIEETLTKMSLEIRAGAEAPRANYADLARGPLRLITLCSCFMWAVTGLTFFGYNQYISQTSSNPFVSVAVAGAIQIPADLSAIWLIRKFGRKATTASCFCLAGLCIITLGCISPGFWLSLILGSLGVSFAAIDATTIYIYTSELYPTVVRNMGIGLSSTSMRIGSMAAPFVANLVMTVPWLPTLIFGAAPILAAFVTLLLPETKGRTLPDSIEDVASAK